MSDPVEAIYEHGVLRLFRPIDLAEGTRVEVVVITRLASDKTGTEKTPVNRTPAEVAAGIASLAVGANDDGFSGRDHDRVLYGAR
jgi:predicted DNA-binding antitoxin AbrB/MazE fold protein